MIIILAKFGNAVLQCKNLEIDFKQCKHNLYCHEQKLKDIKRIIIDRLRMTEKRRAI